MKCERQQGPDFSAHFEDVVNMAYLTFRIFKPISSRCYGWCIVDGQNLDRDEDRCRQNVIVALVSEALVRCENFEIVWSKIVLVTDVGEESLLQHFLNLLK